MAASVSRQREEINDGVCGGEDGGELAVGGGARVRVCWGEEDDEYYSFFIRSGLGFQFFLEMDIREIGVD